MMNVYDLYLGINHGLMFLCGAYGATWIYEWGHDVKDMIYFGV